jgi:hypothetical protein
VEAQRRFFDLEKLGQLFEMPPLARFDFHRHYFPIQMSDKIDFRRIASFFCVPEEEGRVCVTIGIGEPFLADELLGKFCRIYLMKGYRTE